jgi:hypothetical protein
VSAVPPFPQEPPPGGSEDAEYLFFAGSVEEFNDDEIVVRRALSGRHPEVKHFIRNAETRITGTLERGARVVVAYTTENGHDIAWRVMVRPPAKEHPAPDGAA